MRRARRVRVLYPLTILATWFHEMGHGLCGSRRRVRHLWQRFPGEALLDEGRQEFCEGPERSACEITPGVVFSLLILSRLANNLHNMQNITSVGGWIP